MDTGNDQSQAAGPSRARTVHIPITNGINNIKGDDGDGPSAQGTVLSCTSRQPNNQVDDGDEEEDEDRIDIKTIQSFADKVQYAGGDGSEVERPRINIPKRGEKDFEPLQETVNLQEKMLQRSREALFNALVGVRGGNSKSISHALLTPSSPFPRLLITRGHVLDSMGISIRHSIPGARSRTYSELLPEEALYLLERGSLQIWVGPGAETSEQASDGLGEWCDDEYGVKGAIEMSVKEGFGLFLGKEGLTWERYQAYAYLKRLGYTVQRTRQFLPPKFTLASTSIESRHLLQQDHTLPEFETWWLRMLRGVSGLLRWVTVRASSLAHRVSDVGLRPSLWWRSGRLADSLLDSWSGTTYKSLFAELRLIPSSHEVPLPSRRSPSQSSTVYSPLDSNPYLPFFHVWKPAVPWSKAKWDKGSELGLARQKPDYAICAVEARTTPLPSIHQLNEIFNGLPDEPKGPTKKLGPQYERKLRVSRSGGSQVRLQSGASRFVPGWLRSSCSESLPPQSQNNPMGALRNGDRAVVVAVNDSGNTGWIRFGRTGFAENAVM